MDRTVVSKSLQGYKYLPLILMVAIPVSISQSSQNIGSDAAVLIAIPILVLACLFYAYKAHQSKQVSYDEQLMYLTLREEEESVPLKNIESIKLTMDSLGRRKMLWKITYLDKGNKTQSLKILPIWDNGIFEGFHAAVKTHNPKVIIKNTANSWSN